MQVRKFKKEIKKFGGCPFEDSRYLLSWIRSERNWIKLERKKVLSNEGNRDNIMRIKLAVTNQREETDAPV